MTNLKLIHELYRSFGEGDKKSLGKICTPGIEWVQNEGFPGGATYRGVDAIMEGVFEGNRRRWDGFRA